MGLQTFDGQGPVLEGAWELLQEHAAFRLKWGLSPTYEAGSSSGPEAPPLGGEEVGDAEVEMGEELGRRRGWRVPDDGGIPELRVQVRCCTLNHTP